MNASAPHEIRIVHVVDYAGETDAAGQPIDPVTYEERYTGRADVQWGDARIQRSTTQDRKEVDVTVVLPDYTGGVIHEIAPNDVVEWRGTCFRIVEMGYIWNAIFARRDASCDLPTTSAQS